MWDGFCTTYLRWIVKNSSFSQPIGLLRHLGMSIAKFYEITIIQESYQNAILEESNSRYRNDSGFISIEGDSPLAA